MPQTALMPGNDDRVGYWLTPPDMMAKLQAEFDFDFDACPYPRPAGFDGLKEVWGSRTWCNPPFKGGVLRWARKALAEHSKGKLVVLILPSSRIDDAAGPLLAAGAETRLYSFFWRNPKGDSKRIQASVLFILRPFTSGQPKRDEMESR